MSSINEENDTERTQNVHNCNSSSVINRNDMNIVQQIIESYCYRDNTVLFYCHYK